MTGPLLHRAQAEAAPPVVERTEQSPHKRDEGPAAPPHGKREPGPPNALIMPARRDPTCGRFAFPPLPTPAGLPSTAPARAAASTVQRASVNAMACGASASWRWTDARAQPRETRMSTAAWLALTYAGLVIIGLALALTFGRAGRDN